MVVQRDDKVIASAGSCHVEHPVELGVGVSRLHGVKRLEIAEDEATVLSLGADANSDTLSREVGAIRRCLVRVRLRSHPGEDDDRKLESLRSVNGEHPYRVFIVVEAGALVVQHRRIGLLLQPLHKGAEALRPGRLESTRAFYHEAGAAEAVAVALIKDTGLDQAAVENDALNDGSEGAVVADGVEFGDCSETVGDGAIPIGEFRMMIVETVASRTMVS